MLTDKELDEIEARLSEKMPWWMERDPGSYTLQLLADAVTLLAEVRRIHHWAYRPLDDDAP